MNRALMSLAAIDAERAPLISGITGLHGICAGMDMFSLEKTRCSVVLHKRNRLGLTSRIFAQGPTAALHEERRDRQPRKAS
jgi:hypothetical protein